MKPMLAETLPVGVAPAFPVAATPKLDGIRALKVGGRLVSRSFKPIPNVSVRAVLEEILPDGADGELMYGTSFQECTSAVMRAKQGAPTKGFKYFWFDYVHGDGQVPYAKRMEAMRAYVRAHGKTFRKHAAEVEIVPLYPTLLRNEDELDAYENRVVGEGYEGVIVRDPDGPYKFGRSTLREGLMLKIKRFLDAEAIVVGAEELMHNENEATTNALGNKKRSSHKKNKVPAGTLGALVVEDPHQGFRFNIGTGFTDAGRADLWKRRDSLVGKLVKYKYMSVGVKTAPRHPVFLGFRHKNDM